MLPATILALIFALPFTLTTSLIHNQQDVSSTSKAGLAWPNGDGVDVQQYRTTGKVSWYYSWSPYSFDTDLEFVPMLWGQKSVDQFSSTINETISKRNVKAALGMNEPQESGQSNLTPEQGAEMWKAYMEPLRLQGVRLGSPAPSSAPSGKTWIQAFLMACAGGCTIDFIALHYYDVNATQFMEYLNDYHETFQKPLWVTEWACQNYNDVKAQCSQDDIVLFLNATQTFMDNSKFVERYAWFGAIKIWQADALMDSGGTINALGRQYIGSGSVQTDGSGNADGPKAPGGEGVTFSGCYGKSSRSEWYTAVLVVSVATLLLI